jgi:hypothetical protein
MFKKNRMGEVDDVPVPPEVAEGAEIAPAIPPPAPTVSSSAPTLPPAQNSPIDTTSADYYFDSYRSDFMKRNLNIVVSALENVVVILGFMKKC